MICLDFDWQIDEFMVYCRSTQLRAQTMKSYEQTLCLFERWCLEQMDITTVVLFIRQDVTQLCVRFHFMSLLYEERYHTGFFIEPIKCDNT